MEAERINRFRFRYLLWVIVTTVPIYLRCQPRGIRRLTGRLRVRGRSFSPDPTGYSSLPRPLWSFLARFSASVQ